MISLFNNKRVSVLGLDISSTSVKLLELNQVGDSYRIESYAVSALPANAVVENNINEVDKLLYKLNKLDAMTDLINEDESHSESEIDFENMMTVYGTIALNDNIYVKAGYMEVDVNTNEVLATGGSYGNTSLDGFVLGLGYNRDLDTGAFVRVEANYMEFDGATLTNTADSTKSVTADGITGYGAKLSIGKAF